MNEEESENLKDAVPVQVFMVAKTMTLPELLAVCNAASLDFDPREVMGYKKARSLFTANDHTKMHADTLAALNAVIADRLRELSPQED